MSRSYCEWVGWEEECSRKKEVLELKWEGLRWEGLEWKPVWLRQGGEGLPHEAGEEAEP